VLGGSGYPWLKPELRPWHSSQSEPTGWLGWPATATTARYATTCHLCSTSTVIMNRTDAPSNISPLPITPLHIFVFATVQPHSLALNNKALKMSLHLFTRMSHFIVGPMPLQIFWIIVWVYQDTALPLPTFEKICL